MADTPACCKKINTTHTQQLHIRILECQTVVSAKHSCLWAPFLSIAWSIDIRTQWQADAHAAHTCFDQAMALLVETDHAKAGTGVLNGLNMKTSEVKPYI